MLKLRKGDIWKAVALTAAIVLVGVFLYRQLKSFAGPPGAPQKTVADGTAATAGQGGALAADPESQTLFAERPRKPAADLARARTASDPFRPYFVGVAGAAKEGGAKRASGPGPLEADFGELRLIGVISGGRRPLAVLRDGSRRFHVGVGDSLPGGWRLGPIDANGATLVKGGERVRVPLASASSRKSR
jgi:hypothetical protein